MVVPLQVLPKELGGKAELVPVEKALAEFKSEYKIPSRNGVAH